MVNVMSNMLKGSPYHNISDDSVGRNDLSFDGSENTNLIVEELLHKTEAPALISQPNSREVHLLTARRRLSLGGDDARRRVMSRNVLFPPTFPQNHPNQYDAVRGLPPQDQTKEWWKMLYGDDKTHCHIRTTIPRSAPSKSCLSTSKSKDRTPNSVASRILLDTPVGANTPMKRCVKFGSASAAEFEKDDPPQGSLTPMPPTKAAQRFPTDFKEPDRETANLIAMTKENSATLAEWDYFDDSDDDNENFQSPLEHRRSRRESGRFIPFCETDAYETNEDDAFAMDAVETTEIHVDEAVEMDVGKTGEHEMLNAKNGEDLLVEMSSTATQLFTNLAISLEAERQNAELSRNSLNKLERELLECRDSMCLAEIEECLDVTLRRVVDPQVSIIQTKRFQYQLKSNPDLNAMIMTGADFHFRSAFTDALECINFAELHKRLQVQTERVTRAIACLEKASKRKLADAIALEEESIKSLEQVLLAAKISKESLRRRNLEQQLLRSPRAPLTYYVMNFIAPFQLMDGSQNEIKLDFSTSKVLCRLQLSADIKGGHFVFQQPGRVDDIVEQDGVAVLSGAILSAVSAELQSDLSLDSLPLIVFRVSQVLHRLEQFLSHFQSLAATCEVLSVKEDGSLLSVTLSLPDMTKVKLVYNLSRSFLLDLDSFRPEVSIHYYGNTSTELFPPLSQFLEGGFF